MQQKQLLVSQKEIDEHLEQLNLTHDPSLVRSRRQWFYTNKVKIFTLFGRTYQEPPEIKAIEIITHIEILTSHDSELKQIIEEAREAGIALIKDGKEYSNSDNNDIIERANKCLKEIKQAVLWFKSKRLKLKRTTVLETSFYQYDGVDYGEE